MNYLAFDLETTGVEPGSRIVEVAAVLFENGRPTDRFVELVNPEMPIPEDVTKIHGITNDMVKHARAADLVLHDAWEWAIDASLNANERLPLVIHNAPFDCGIVDWETQRTGRPNMHYTFDVVDTLAVARQVEKGLRSHALAKLVELRGIKVPGDAHRAEHDAIAAGLYYADVQALADYLPSPWGQYGGAYAYAEDFPEELALLPTWVGLGLPFTFTYEDQSGEVTDRTVTPHGWALMDGKLRFHGFCHLRQARRTFLCERVLQVRDVEAVA